MPEKSRGSKRIEVIAEYVPATEAESEQAIAGLARMFGIYLEMRRQKAENIAKLKTQPSVPVHKIF